MLNRVVEICEEERYLSLNRGFIVIKQKEEHLTSVPIDDIAVLLISAQSAVFSKNILNALAEKGCITVLCGKNYLPQSMVVPENSHYLFTKILNTQIRASLPFKKRIWQQIVIRKIQNQAQTLVLCGKKDDAILVRKISKLVESGDPKNREAYAAKMYWKALFGETFIRDKDGDGINALLNYGYAIIRSCMARFICSAGLLPALGVHHENYTNQFCLVDDFFEIYRPIVDCIVYKLVLEEKPELTPSVKKALAQTLKVMVHTREGVSQVCTSMHYMACSYVNALETKKASIELPEWKGDEDGITVVE